MDPLANEIQARKCDEKKDKADSINVYICLVFKTVLYVKPEDKG